MNKKLLENEILAITIRYEKDAKNTIINFKEQNSEYIARLQLCIDDLTGKLRMTRVTLGTTIGIASQVLYNNYAGSCRTELRIIALLAQYGYDIVWLMTGIRSGEYFRVPEVAEHLRANGFDTDDVNFSAKSFEPAITAKESADKEEPTFDNAITYVDYEAPQLFFNQRSGSYTNSVDFNETEHGDVIDIFQYTGSKTVEKIVNLK